LEGISGAIMSIMSMVGFFSSVPKALEEARAVKTSRILQQAQIRPTGRQIKKIMDIKLIELRGSIHNYSRRFTVSIDEIKLDGIVSNIARTQKQLEKVDKSYNLGLKFDNKQVKEHPKYKEIRKEVLLQIIEAASKEYTYPGSSNFLTNVGI
jgi:hypothetical protein